MSRHLDDSTVERLCRIVREEAPAESRYVIGEAIGQGGMGTVYRAEDLALGRPVAMKVLRDGVAEAIQAERILREARTIARLEHPGIVPVHDAGRLPDGRVFYTMKLVNGRRLDGYAQADISLQERLRLFERICEATAFAHARGVLHRDLKPQNIMVGEFGEVLVLDWGVAKVSDGRARHPMNQISCEADTKETAFGTVIGTPAYMAPEQARGEIDRIDQRSDVYALGGVLHFLLTGKAPQTKAGGNPGAFGLVPARQLNRAIPKRLESICIKALAYEPAERYASAADMAGDVGRFLNGQAVLAHREGPLERAGRWAWWYRVPIFIIGAYVLMRALFIWWRRV